ncbi:hypothetical protein D9M71_461500 [compost metagenome]
MRVQQDDFVGFSSGVDLAGVAQPDHVLGEVAPVIPAHTGLAHHEGLEAFAAQLLQHGRGRDVAVALGAAFVRGLGEDGRGHGANLLIRQGGFRAQHRGAVREAGSKLHGRSPDKDCCQKPSPDS